MPGRPNPSVLPPSGSGEPPLYVILAEGRLVLPEAQAPQPDHNVHDMSQSRVEGIMVAPKGGVQLGTVRPITARPVPITIRYSVNFWL